MIKIATAMKRGITNQQDATPGSVLFICSSFAHSGIYFKAALARWHKDTSAHGKQRY